MNDKQIVKISLLMGFLGTLLLIYLNSLNITQNEQNITLGNYVTVKGQVLGKFESSKIGIINLQTDLSLFKVVYYPKQDINVEKGDYISVKGLVRDYKGTLEIEAKEIELIEYG